jgi:hypothetical protein
MAGTPLPDVPGILRIRFQGKTQTHLWNNLFFAKYTGAPGTQAQINALASSLRGAWAGSFSAVLAASDSLDTTTVWDLSNRNLPSGLNSVSSPGAHAELVRLPPQVAAVISWTVPDRWRGGHFRTYIPVPDAASVVGATIQAAYLTALGGAATAWETQLRAINYQGAPLEFVGVRYHGDTTAGQIYPRVLTMAGHKVKSRVDSMRRRSGKEVS